MTIDGKNYRLTKHGRARFIKRVGMDTDVNIIRRAVEGSKGFRFIWKPDHREGQRLVTVLYDTRSW